MKRMLAGAFLAIAVTPFAGLADDPTVLIDFTRDAPSIVITADKAAARLVTTAKSQVLRLDSTAAADRATVHLQPRQGLWDFWRFTFLVAEVRNAGSATCTVQFLMETLDGDGRTVQRQYNRKEELASGEEVLMKGALYHNAGKDDAGRPIRVFGMRTTPYGVSPKTNSYADPARVRRIGFSVDSGGKEAAIEISRIYGLGSAQLTAPASGFFPFIDRYGQYIHDDWEGKIHSDEDLIRQRERETGQLAQWSRPADWDRWGGWKDGPTREATGHFRVEKYEGRWWLVDPDGKLFFSHGVACVRSGDEMVAGSTTPITGREDYFRDLPATSDPVFGAFFTRVESQIAQYGRRIKPLCYNLAGANMRRKYGEGFASYARQLALDRLTAWGYNTMGAWSDERICLAQQAAYTPIFDSFRTAGRRLGGNSDKDGNSATGGGFADVFASEFATTVSREVAAAVKPTRDDPWCIGYFFGNEIPWPDFEQQIPRWTCEAPPDQPAKRHLMEQLKGRYGDISALNGAWKCDYASWDHFLSVRQAPTAADARGDLNRFMASFLDRYFGTIRRALDEHAPRKLYLGCRFNTWTAPPARAAARHCHIVSYNLYRWPGSAGRFRIAGGVDAPLLIGEWHFGTLDHGMFDPGMRLVLDQQQRAEHYGAYMNAVRANPQCVGAHWFRYGNHPATGRASEGANAHNGLVDICDTPYRQTIEAARTVGLNLYRASHRGPRAR